MANQRDKSKRMVGFFATPEEKKAIQALAKSRGVSVAELLRQLAVGLLKVAVVLLLATHLWRSPSKWNASALAKTANVIVTAMR